MHFNQNISFGKFTNAILSVMALAWAFMSCVQIEENSQGVGYLSFSPISVDCSVENLVPTKANVPAEDMPGSGDFTVTISGNSLNAPIVYEPGNLPDGQIPLAVGTYTVDAVYGANNFGSAYFHASKTIELDVNEVESVSLTEIPLGNAMVAVTLPAKFYDHMSVDAIVLKDASGNSVEIEAGQYEYAPSGREVSVEFSGTNSVGQSKVIEISLGVLEPQHAYDVECSLDLPSVVLPEQSAGAWSSRLYVTPATIPASLPSGQVIYEVIDASSSDWTSPMASSEVIQGEYHVVKGLENGRNYKIRARVGNVISNEVSFTVKDISGTTYSIAHTYDSNGFLTGTDASVDLNLTGIMATLKDAGLLDISVHLKKGTEVYRSSSKISGTMSDSNDWPYIPKGSDYVLEVSHKVAGDDEEVKSSMHPIEVSAPAVTVEVSASTTYDRYMEYKSGNGALSDANNYDKRLVVEGRQVVLKIGNNILQNTKYASLLSGSVTYAGTELTKFAVSASSVNTLTYADVTYTDNQWGSYTFMANIVFDGVEAEDSHTCHITGLPYSRDLRSNSDLTNWFVDGSTEHDDKRGQQIAYVWATNKSKDYAKIYSPAFKLPQTTDIKYSVGAVFYTSGAYKHTEKIYSGIVQNTNGYSQKYKDDISNSTSYGKTVSTYSHDDVMTYDSRISVYHNEWYISGEFLQPQYWMHLATLGVEYR